MKNKPARPEKLKGFYDVLVGTFPKLNHDGGVFIISLIKNMKEKDPMRLYSTIQRIELEKFEFEIEKNMHLHDINNGCVKYLEELKATIEQVRDWEKIFYFWEFGH